MPNGSSGELLGSSWSSSLKRSKLGFITHFETIFGYPVAMPSGVQQP